MHASQGRILILDNVEKAERCVLPLLNNLLENRCAEWVLFRES